MAGVGATEPLMGQDRGCPQATGQREPLCARDEPTVSPAGAVEGLDSSGQNPKPDKANHLRLVAPCLSGRGSNLCCFTGEFSIPQDPA